MKVVGIQSWNVCDTDTLMIKPAINISMNCSDMPYAKRGEQKATIVLDTDSSIRAMLFTCIPGNSPVEIPTVTPRKQKIKISTKSIISYSFNKKIVWFSSFTSTLYLSSSSSYRNCPHTYRVWPSVRFWYFDES